MAYRDALAELRRQRNVAWAQFGVMAALALFLAFGWYRASREFPPLHIPPNLTRGAVVRPGEVPASSVYAFAYYIWQQVNRWPVDGKVDYGKAIFQHQAYLTARFREELLADLERRGRGGELDERARGVQELPGHHFDAHRVEAQGNDLWVVWLDLEVSESYKKTTVKTTQVRYPLRVVRYEVDLARNPFGLALDGFVTGAGPRELTAQELSQR